MKASKSAKSTYLNDTNGVTAFIQKLEPTLSIQVEELRKIILDTNGTIGEHLKWNSPAFFYQGVMQPFNPKEYKRDIIVIHVQKGYPLLIFPTGSVIKDDSGILEGHFEDGRRMITFKGLEEIKNKSEQLKKVIGNWLSQIEQ